MLKKKNIFVAILSFIFCLSMFGGMLIFDNRNEPSIASAEVSVPTLGETNKSGENWTYIYDSVEGFGVLTLKGNVHWTDQLEVSNKVKIELKGENSIDVTGAYDNAILVKKSVEFFGSGTLELKSESAVISFGESAAVGDVKFGEGIQAEDINKAPISVNHLASTIGYARIFGTGKEEATIDASESTITYDGSKYDVSEMFDIPTDAGEVTYSSTTVGLEAENDLAEVDFDENSSLITIKKCGKINIKASVAENENYAATEAVATLTIQRADLVAGNADGGVYIIISAGFDDEGQEIDAIGWIERSEDELESNPHDLPGIRNLPDDCDFEYEMTYWLNGTFTVPTTTDHRAPAQNKMPESMGRYFIKAEIEKSDLYNELTVSREFVIKRKISCISNPEMYSITYKNIVDGKIDLSELFVIEDYDDCKDAIESISYFYSLDGSKFELLDTSLFEIDGINDLEHGDSYMFSVSIYVKDDSLFIGTRIDNVAVVVKKVEADLGEFSIYNKAYDGKPCELYIENEESLGEFTVLYYTNEECTIPVTENNGVPVSIGDYFVKIIVQETEFIKETVKTMSFAIVHNEIEIIWDEDDFVYNGEVQEIEAYYLDVDDQRVDLIVYIDDVFKDAKTYTVSVGIKDEDVNYILPEVYTKQYTIKPMKVVLKISDRSTKYGRNGIPLGVSVQQGVIFNEDTLFTLSLDGDVVITSRTEVGKYKINIEMIENTNYIVDVDNRDSAYYYVTNIITTENMIEDWVYSPTATGSVPSATDMLGSKVKFEYYNFSDSERANPLSEQPKNPGEYVLVAKVVNDQDSWKSAVKEELFLIDKIEVSIPPMDTTVYVFNGQNQEYKIEDIDPENRSLYTIVENKFRDAGIHKVRLEINDYDFYRWPDGEKYYEFDFEIKKKIIEMPTADSRVFKYNGNDQTYVLAAAADYAVSKNVTQKEVGRYKIIVSLLEPNNTMWSDGSTDNLEYDFVINRNQITEATIVDSDGKVIDKDEVLITNVSAGGLSPEVTLKAEILDTDDKEELKTIKAQLDAFLKKYDKIFKVTDVSLIMNGESVQPENSITLKMLVPEELLNANFTLYHIHIDESGKEIISEIEYSEVDKNGYIVFQTDKLSSFVFVYEQSSLVGLIITFACLAALMLGLLIVQLIWFRKNKAGAKVVTASAVPVFYVAGEVASSITLGVVFGLLLAANVVMLVLNLRVKNNKITTKETSKKSESKKETVKKETTKKAVSKTK